MIRFRSVVGQTLYFIICFGNSGETRNLLMSSSVFQVSAGGAVYAVSSSSLYQYVHWLLSPCYSGRYRCAGVTRSSQSRTENVLRIYCESHTRRFVLVRQFRQFFDPVRLSSGCSAFISLAVQMVKSLLLVSRGSPKLPAAASRGDLLTLASYGTMFRLLFSSLASGPWSNNRQNT